MTRATWTGLDDDRLLAQCEVDTYRASGPGGQKRNKTSSAVRLRHGPTGLLVIAEESRSQHDNKAKALKRLRRTLWLTLREPGDAARAEWATARDGDGKFDLPSAKDPRYWPVAAALLDLLHDHAGQVGTVAELLGTTTANAVGLLEMDEHVWQTANRIRTAAGLKPLRM
jgi:hypothetical protein